MIQYDMADNSLNAKKIIEEYFRASGNAVPGNDEGLFETGALDSFGLVEFLTHLERETGIEIPPDKVTEENFSTIKAVESLLCELEGQQ
jgi:acyl carrier protein